MGHRSTWAAAMLLVLAASAQAEEAPPAQVRPILARCVACHNGDERAGELDLSTREAALQGGESGPALSPGDAKGSRLFSQVLRRKMPPKDPLPEAEVEALRAWIDAGAAWAGPIAAAEDPARWAFRPLTDPTPPAIDRPERALDPIDAFVLARLDAAGLEPAPPADRATWLRRATFDLTGLPPTPEEIDAFLNDPAPDAFARVVDRLLDSPAYGERWGRHWLDVARFSESDGFERDRPRDHAWRYRDYVVRSLNADKPYADFVREQVAGDVLEPAPAEGVVATAFLVAGAWDEVGHEQQGALSKARVREDELEDLVAVVAQGFLGLTIQCARCHDHKFDPIPQRDYYRLKAALAGVQHGNRPAPRPDESGLVGPPPPAYAACPAEPPPTFVLARGDVEAPGEQVEAGGLSALGESAGFGLPPGAPEAARRRALADWIADPANPLTARVIVNRVWHYHFGTGLVATPSDFGANGERPSHPELLDRLARDFLATGGRLKALHRRIMLSATYRRSSRFDPRAAAVDADDRLLWRFPPRRLEGEAARDAMLAAAGRLDRTTGGPPFRPFVVKAFNSIFYEPIDPVGPGFDRRTIYRMNINSAKDVLLDALDCPDPSVKTPRRAATTTPLQALGLMNDALVHRQARALAERLGSGPGGLAGRVERAYLLALGRRPSGDEAARCAEVAREHGLEAVAWVLFNTSEFLEIR